MIIYQVIITEIDICLSDSSIFQDFLILTYCNQNLSMGVEMMLVGVGGGV